MASRMLVVTVLLLRSSRPGKHFNKQMQTSRVWVGIDGQTTPRHVGLVGLIQMLQDQTRGRHLSRLVITPIGTVLRTSAQADFHPLLQDHLPARHLTLPQLTSSSDILP